MTLKNPVFIGQLHRPGPGDYVLCLEQRPIRPEACHGVCSAGPGRTLTCASSDVSSSNSAYRSLADERIDVDRVTREVNQSCSIGNRFILSSTTPRANTQMAWLKALYARCGHLRRQPGATF